jgi:hypothetical protein
MISLVAIVASPFVRSARLGLAPGTLFGSPVRACLGLGRSPCDVVEQRAVGSVDDEVEGGAFESPLAFVDQVVVFVVEQDQVIHTLLICPYVKAVKAAAHPSTTTYNNHNDHH